MTPKEQQKEFNYKVGVGCIFSIILFVVISVLIGLNFIFAFSIFIILSILIFLGYYFNKKAKIDEEELMNNWFGSKKKINDLYQLHPTEFEIFIAELYSRLGYKTQRTKTSGDEGIDVIAEKDGKKYVIQVKKSSKPIGSPVIQKLYGSMAHAFADYAICVSLAGYTTQARRFAENKLIELLDGNDLIDLIKQGQQFKFNLKGDTANKKFYKAKFNCVYCNKSFFNNLDLRQIKNKKDLNLMIQCPNCNRYLNLSIDSDQTWTCDKCGKIFHDEIETNKHEKRCKRNIRNKLFKNLK